MKNVTLQNFETDVMAASLNTPILIDFHAPWCAPCKALGPLLEQMEQEYQGRFILVKINSDEEPQLAQAFGVRSIPTCILMMDGKAVNAFAGAQSASQVRTFLDQHLPSTGELTALTDTDEAKALLASGNTQAAMNLLCDALATDPGNDDIRYDYVRLLLELGGVEEAQAALAPKLSDIPKQLRFVALSHWLDAILFIAGSAYATWGTAQFDEKIAANKRDFETRFAKARWWMTQGEWTAAMDELLEIIMRDKTWDDESPRKNMVAILELLTPPKPKATAQIPGKTNGGIEVTGKTATTEDPKAALVSTYRRRLSMMLN